MRIVLILSMLGLVLSGGGCASIVDGGGRQNLSIRTTPSDATVTIYDLRNKDKIVSKTQSPTIVNLRTGDGYFRSAKYRVVVEKAGYKPEEITVDCGVRAWYVGGNLVFGGLIGYLIVDPATGAMWKFAPETHDKALTAATASADGTTLAIMLRDQVTPEMERQMVPIQRN